jgi:hypothetical protein
MKSVTISLEEILEIYKDFSKLQKYVDMALKNVRECECGNSFYSISEKAIYCNECLKANVPHKKWEAENKEHRKKYKRDFAKRKREQLKEAK